MKLALVGYGKMGALVEQTAARQDLPVTARFTSKQPLAPDTPRHALDGATVAVDFSVGAAVPATVQAAAALGLNLVIGTTGWHDRLAEVRRVAEDVGLGVVHAANFSLGVQLFYRAVEHAARLFSAFEAYDPYLQEAHHKAKLDSPSGTALELRRRLQAVYADTRGTRPDVPTTSLRAGHVPGTHSVGFDSEADTVVLEHRARSRQGFAHGALLAARWIDGKSGFFAFEDLLADLESTAATGAGGAPP